MVVENAAFLHNSVSGFIGRRDGNSFGNSGLNHGRRLFGGCFGRSASQFLIVLFPELSGCPRHQAIPPAIFSTVRSPWRRANRDRMEIARLPSRLRKVETASGNTSRCRPQTFSSPQLNWPM